MNTKNYLNLLDFKLIIKNIFNKKLNINIKEKYESKDKFNDDMFFIIKEKIFNSNLNIKNIDLKCYKSICCAKKIYYKI